MHLRNHARGDSKGQKVSAIEIMTTKEYGIVPGRHLKFMHAARQIGLPQEREVSESWFLGREAEYGMFLKRLGLLKGICNN